MDSIQLEGLKVKYDVYKVSDGSKVNDCFVLRPQKDFAARIALRVYALYCGNSQLKEDIYKWLRGLPKLEVTHESN